MLGEGSCPTKPVQLQRKRVDIRAQRSIQGAGSVEFQQGETVQASECGHVSWIGVRSGPRDRRGVDAGGRGNHTIAQKTEQRRAA